MIQQENLTITIDTPTKDWLNRIATATGRTVEQVAREYLLKGMGHFAPFAPD